MGKKYSNDDLRNIAEELVVELKEVDDGTVTTTNRLARDYGYTDLDMDGLFTLDNYLFKIAKANKIILDKSEHENKLEGLPYNLTFVVRNKKAQIMCPRCGSTNTARYLYGYPAFSNDLQRKIDAGKIILSGCCISSVDVNGEQVFDMPTRYCKECKKDFGTPPILHNKKEDKWEDYRDIVAGIKFDIGGYFGGFTTITLNKNAHGANVHVDQSISPDNLSDMEDKQITPAKWNRIVCKLYDKFYIHEWNKNYTDIGVLDGTQWEIGITLKGGRKRTYGGSNAYPPNWSAFVKLFKEFANISK